jgi:threonine/homoserine/homoserine lactone efflux protein
MDSAHWLSFLVFLFLGCASPGPNMLMMLSSGMAYGFGRTFYVMLGCLVSVLSLIMLSLLGVGTLLKLYPAVYSGLCVIGALYLIWLGIQAWRAPIMVNEEGEVVTARESLPPFALMRKGFLVGISNPKALLFAAAFFPQFIDPDLPRLPQFVQMLVAFVVIEMGCYIAYAHGGRKLADWVLKPQVKRGVNRLSGGIFILFGVALVAQRFWTFS